MTYLHQHFRTRVDPRALLDGALSVVVVALLYNQPWPKRPANVASPLVGDARSAFTPPTRGGATASPTRQAEQEHGPRGRVARYAWGRDYHKVVKAKLLAMLERMRAELPDPFEAKICVDTAPILERELAAAAGIGWIGKNTMVLDRRLGSYFFLGELVTTLDLQADQPLVDRCGSCTACLDACPTDALPAPHQMDASRCISYLTIEHRQAIPEELTRPMGDWIFGCDICQDVCPYNRRAPVTLEPMFAMRPPGPEPLLQEILGYSPQDYRANLRGSAMKRATLDMLRRNARIALDNVR